MVGALLERFYDPSEGVVEVDGVSVAALDLRWLRSNVGAVSQVGLSLPGGCQIGYMEWVLL
jgi:ABC-type multidrug transport system fused ATPase/permease subunit